MATGAAAAGIGIVVAGTAAQMIAARKAAKAEERALRAKADAKRIQATELLKRSEFNIKELELEAEEFKAAQTTSFAKAGVALGTGVSLSALEDTQARLTKAVNQSRKEAQFKAGQLRAGADIDSRLASDSRSVSRRERAGIFLGGAGKIATLSAISSGGGGNA